jgi:predicted RNA-binding Zn ribbon-like protein
MGIVETWVREKPIRTFLARLSSQSAAASTSSAPADGESAGADGGIPQLSPIANSVVSRCSGYGLPNREFVPVLVGVGVEA